MKKDKVNYRGELCIEVMINGKTVKLLSNQTLTMIDSKGGYLITDNECSKNIEITDATYKVE